MSYTSPSVHEENSMTVPEVHELQDRECSAEIECLLALSGHQNTGAVVVIQFF